MIVGFYRPDDWGSFSAITRSFDKLNKNHRFVPPPHHRPGISSRTNPIGLSLDRNVTFFIINKRCALPSYLRSFQVLPPIRDIYLSLSISGECRVSSCIYRQIHKPSLTRRELDSQAGPSYTYLLIYFNVF